MQLAGRMEAEGKLREWYRMPRRVGIPLQWLSIRGESGLDSGCKALRGRGWAGQLGTAVILSCSHRSQGVGHICEHSLHPLLASSLSCVLLPSMSGTFTHLVSDPS